MLTNETKSIRIEGGKAASILGASSCVGRGGTRSCTTCKAACRVLGSSLLDARCVISVPGQTFEVPALFMAWMFDEPENEITEEAQNKPQDHFGIKGPVSAAQGAHLVRIKPGKTMPSQVEVILVSKQRTNK
jgi:hypothetical protein